MNTKTPSQEGDDGAQASALTADDHEAIEARRVVLWLRSRAMFAGRTGNDWRRHMLSVAAMGIARAYSLQLEE